MNLKEFLGGTPQERAAINTLRHLSRDDRHVALASDNAYRDRAHDTLKPLRLRQLGAVVASVTVLVAGVAGIINEFAPDKPDTSDVPTQPLTQPEQPTGTVD